MTLRKRLREIEVELQTLGCGDHGCVVRKPTGLGVNAGCRCLGTTLLWTPDSRMKLRKALMLRQEQVQILERLVRGDYELCE